MHYSIEVTKKIYEKVFKYSNFINTFSYKLRNYINYLNYLSSFYSLNIMNFIMQLQVRQVIKKQHY